MDLQKLVNAMSEQGSRKRGNYHLTFGKLIEALKNAKETDRIKPTITGIGAYRGYYSDLALMTETTGTEPMYAESFDYMTVTVEEMEKLKFSIEQLSENPHELAKQFESMVGKYTDGYKGGLSIVELDTPLWIASDYGNCSGKAVVGISENLELVLKEIE